MERAYHKRRLKEGLTANRATAGERVWRDIAPSWPNTPTRYVRIRVDGRCGGCPSGGCPSGGGPSGGSSRSGVSCAWDNGSGPGSTRPHLALARCCHAPTPAIATSAAARAARPAGLRRNTNGPPPVSRDVRVAGGLYGARGVKWYGALDATPGLTLDLYALSRLPPLMSAQSAAVARAAPTAMLLPSSACERTRS